jgi:large-conductance mechanosensitive channel
MTATNPAFEFIEMIKNFNVVGMALGIIIGQSVVEVSNSFIDSIFMPTVTPLIQKFTGNDLTLNVYFFTIKLDKFINAIIKFFSIMILLFFMLQLGVKFAKPTNWVNIRGIAPDLKIPVTNK